MSEIIHRKTLAQHVFDVRLSPDGVKTLIKISVRGFNFIDLCSVVGIVWSTTTLTRVSDATAVTFSVKCFNTLKLTLSSIMKHLKKVVCFSVYLFTTI